MADTSLCINEAMADNDSVLRDGAGQFDDWVELYNTSTQTVSLKGWILDDGNLPWVIEAEAEIPAGGTALLWLDGQPDQGPDHAPFRLSDGGETLNLYDPTGLLVDTLDLQPTGNDISYGRFPDGGVVVGPTIFATPGTANPVDPGMSTDPSDLLFPADEVLRVDLELTDQAMMVLTNDNQAAVSAAVTVLGQTWDPVELTIKGGIGSEREFDEKAAFRLNLDRYLPGARIRGQEHLTLNNMVQDPSATHEALSYALMRDAGIPAPRVAHVELYMNGLYRGLYLNVETVDDQFLQRHFDDPSGNLYEGAYGADVTPWNYTLLDLDEVGPGDVDDRSELLRLVEFLDQPPTEALWPEFQQHIDTERTLRMLAAEVVTQHWDGYFWSSNNYRIYHEPSTDRWTLLPWGTDQTFGWTFAGIHDASGEIASFCMAIPSCRAEYDNALWEMSDRLIAMDIEGLVLGIHGRVLPLFELDPYREATPEDMTSSAGDTVSSARDYANDVKATLGVP